MTGTKLAVTRQKQNIKYKYKISTEKSRFKCIHNSEKDI